MAFLDTLGFEIEGVGLDRDGAYEALSSTIPNIATVLTVGKDASVESTVKFVSPTISFFNHDFLSKKCESQYDARINGYEITTMPLTFDQSEKIINKITNALIRKGEVSSPRASTHIHIGYANSFQLLTSVFAIGLWIEPLLYKLAGMGGCFRGSINHSIYCRPLELSVAVLGEDANYYSLLNTAMIMNSKHEKDFWLHYGISIEHYKANLNRYHPARYFGVNLLAIPLHGTIEFRHFNSTLNADWILAVARMCQAIAELSSKVSTRWVSSLEQDLKSDHKKSITSEFSNSDYYAILDKLEWLFDKHDLTFNTTSKHRKTLRSIIEESETPLFDNQIPKSHIKQFVLPTSFLANGYHTPVESPIDSGYLDIHNIGATQYSVISSEDK